jgi:hypothetical protein
MTAFVLSTPPPSSCKNIYLQYCKTYVKRVPVFYRIKTSWMSTEVWSHSGLTQTIEMSRDIPWCSIIYLNLFQLFRLNIRYIQTIHSTKTHQNFVSLCEQCWIWMTFRNNKPVWRHGFHFATFLLGMLWKSKRSEGNAIFVLVCVKGGWFM